MASQDAVRPAEATPSPPRVPAHGLRRQVRHARWVAYAWGVVILASLLVATPLALGSIGRQLIAPPEKQVYVLSGQPSPGAASAAPADGSYFNVAVASLDEAKKVVTLRLSGHRACRGACPAFRLRFFSLSDHPVQRAGLPPSATVTVAEGTSVRTESIELPVSGLPSLYPFDRYELLLATAVTTDDEAGGDRPARSVYDGNLLVTLDSELPRQIMLPPQVDRAPAVQGATAEVTFQHVADLRFVRPLHLQILTALLVALMAAAALLTVITEPLRRLVVGIGSVVLGVWGVRAILVSDAPQVITAVDLLLSGVILILLYGIAIRVLLVLRHEGWDSLMRIIRE
ncbi:MAG TPA: hypothetical protein VFE37_28550 [Chloroflexota bacterium]|nr:hypothetical protein [Chloroflexota bacterium]